MSAFYLGKFPLSSFPAVSISSDAGLTTLPGDLLTAIYILGVLPMILITSRTQRIPLQWHINFWRCGTDGFIYRTPFLWHHYVVSQVALDFQLCCQSLFIPAPADHTSLLLPGPIDHFTLLTHKPSILRSHSQRFFSIDQTPLPTVL